MQVKECKKCPMLYKNACVGTNTDVRLVSPSSCLMCQRAYEAGVYNEKKDWIERNGKNKEDTAQWIMKDDDDSLFYHYECSCCEFNSYFQTSFCPNCGKSMTKHKKRG